MPELGIDNYRYMNERSFTDEDRKRLEAAISLLRDEIADAESTADMFPELGWVAKFLLRNRRIADKLFAAK